jgi:hypothetical protein
VVTAAPRNPLIADLSTLAVFGHALAGAVRASVLAIVAQAVDASEADQALITNAVRHLVGGGLARISLAYPACRWYSPRPQQQRLPPTSPGCSWYAMFCLAWSSCSGPHGGSRSWWF